MGLATALSAAGLAIAAGSSAAGFAQQGKQNRLRKSGERSRKALEEAKEKLM